MKVIGLGEIMMRLSTPENMKVENIVSLDTYFGGGEYNTLINLAGLGHETKIITALPKNQLAGRIRKQARGYSVNIDYSIENEGRLGTYYTLLGDDVSPTQVIYDRSGSAFAISKFSDYDLKAAFKDCDLFHISGITPALTESTRTLTIEAIRLAKKSGIKVSYDSNFRAKLWTQSQAGAFLEEVLPLIDYAFLGILDLKYLLNIDVDDLTTGYQLLQSKYPNIKLFASTNREVVSTSEHNLSVNIYTDKLYETASRNLKVKDRIGGGDVFTAGILDGILLKKEPQDIAEFALADAVIKHYRIGDNMDITRDEVESIISGTSLKINR